MGANASRVKYHFDKAPAVTLRLKTDAAEVATATEAGISLDELRAYWQNKEIPHGTFAVVFDVDVLDGTGDATYDLSLVVDDVAAMNDNPVVVAGPIRVTAPGSYVLVVDSASIPLLDTDATGLDKFIASSVAVGGATGKSIGYGAWIAKCLGA